MLKTFIYEFCEEKYVTIALGIEEKLKKKDWSASKPQYNPVFTDVAERARAAKIQKMLSYPEYQNVDAFVEFAYDDEQRSFTDMHLQAVARNTFGIDAPNMKQLDYVKSQIESFGLTFIPRTAIKTVRGPRSNVHGQHPFANSGGGGSGASSGGIGLGGGPGVVGGGVEWNAGASTSLPMGSRRK